MKLLVCFPVFFNNLDFQLMAVLELSSAFVKGIIFAFCSIFKLDFGRALIWYKNNHLHQEGETL